MDAKTRKRLRNRRYRTAEHKRLKAELRPVVAAGGVLCARCGEEIPPDEPWDLGHDDTHIHFYSGPEHVWCNRSAPHRNVTSREW